jgi:ferredoxin
MATDQKKIAKIVIDRDLCIGAASCVTIAPDVFQMDDENKAVLVPDADSAWADFDTVLLAAQSCPTLAIFLYDEEGSQLYPDA